MSTFNIKEAQTNLAKLANIHLTITSLDRPLHLEAKGFQAQITDPLRTIDTGLALIGAGLCQSGCLVAEICPGPVIKITRPTGEENKYRVKNSQEGFIPVSYLTVDAPSTFRNSSDCS